MPIDTRSVHAGLAKQSKAKNTYLRQHGDLQILRQMEQSVGHPDVDQRCQQEVDVLREMNK